MLNLLLMFVVFVALMRYQWTSQRSAFFASIFTFLGAFIVEYIYRKYGSRTLKVY